MGQTCNKQEMPHAYKSRSTSTAGWRGEFQIAHTEQRFASSINLNLNCIEDTTVANVLNSLNASEINLNDEALNKELATDLVYKKID